MRYFIKAYPMHEDEVHALHVEAGSGSFESADIHEGLVSGIADESAIARLAEKGIIVQALGMAPEEGGPLTETDDDPSPSKSIGSESVGPEVGIAALNARIAAAGFDPTSKHDRPGYWLADLQTGITDEAISELERAGAEIIERDPSGSFVLRTSGNEAAIDGISFVQRLRPYGVADTLTKAASQSTDAVPVATAAESDEADTGGAPGIGPASSAADSGPAGFSGADNSAPPLSAGRFEAIAHEGVDLSAVASGIGNCGGVVISAGGRAVRFLLNSADMDAVAAIPGVASVAAVQAPQLRSDLARVLIGLERPGPPPISLPFDGSGELIGVADTGIDTDHPDFATKIVTAIPLGRKATGNVDDPNGHGTHVAGTILGDGAASRPPGGNATDPAPLRGVAPAADLYFQSVLDENGALGGLPEPLRDLLQPAYDAGVRIHNNSWGAYIQSRYDSMSLDIDEFVHTNPDFLPIIAAGNEGSCRPGLSSQAGFVDFPSLGSPATAKNAITVGASRSDRTSGGLSRMTWQQAWPQDFDTFPIGNETVSGDSECLAAFSSRGPCDDFRIKPDLVAPGTDIASSRSSKAPLSNFWGAYPRNRHYAFMGGTSMACPVVAGCAALARQYYRSFRGNARPSAALLKATLINGTRVLTGSDAVAAPDGFPNYHQGFGSVNMATTLPDPGNPEFDLFFLDSWERDLQLRFVSRKGRLRWRLDVHETCELRIALVWTDYPGRGLQNQLRMILDTRNDAGSFNWVGNADAAHFINFYAGDPTVVSPGQPNVITRDPQNNVQIIRASVEPGEHTLAIFADGLIRLPQDFALVATYPVGAISVSQRDV